MKLTRIQDINTLKTIRYYINNIRVSKEKYDYETSFLSGYNASYTTRVIKSGNFKHVSHIN